MTVALNNEHGYKIEIPSLSGDLSQGNVNNSFCGAWWCFICLKQGYRWWKSWHRHKLAWSANWGTWGQMFVLGHFSWQRRFCVWDARNDHIGNLLTTIILHFLCSAFLLRTHSYEVVLCVLKWIQTFSWMCNVHPNRW